MASSSPEPNRLLASSSDADVASSSSPIEESPVFVNLSPLKPEKAGPYVPRFAESTFRSPHQVFTSPHLNPQQETRFRDVNLTVNSDAHRQCDTQGQAVHVTCSENETQTCSPPSECVNDYLTDPIKPDSLNSTKLQSQSANDATNSHDRVADDGDAGTKERAEEVLPPSSLKIVETTSEQRTNEMFDANNVESTVYLHPVSGEHSVPEDYICQPPADYKQTAEASEDHNASSRPESNRDNTLDANQNQRGTRRHLQFEASDTGKSITRCNSYNSENLTCDIADSRLPASLTNKQFFSDVNPKGFCSSTQPVSYGGTVTSHSHPFPSKTVMAGNSSVSAPLPISGVGLHLNSLGRSVSIGSNLKLVPQWSHDYAKNLDSSSTSLGVSEKLSAQVHGGQSENQIVVAANTTAFQSTNTTKPMSDSLHLMQVERRLDSCEEIMPVLQNTHRFDELNQGSPKRKRKRGAITSESDGCKRCNCKRSKCLKLYCECFAAGIYCVDSCACTNCFNKPEFEDTVQDTRQQIESRNPLAFAPKIVKQHAMDSPTDLVEDGNWTTPASARHKRGCNCKKSKCLKKYCECYQSKVGCSDACRCDGCKNSFGAKAETVYRRVERWKNESHEKADAGQTRTGINAATGPEQFSSTWHQELEGTTNLTPLPHPCSELVVYSAPSNIPNFPEAPQDQLQSDPSFHWQYPQNICSQQLYSSDDYATYEDIMQNSNTPQMLTEASSTPTKAVQASSPNQKRVSPPKFRSQGLGSSSLRSLRSGGKFILHSVPSFPPLSPYSTSKNSNGNENYDRGCTNDQ